MWGWMQESDQLQIELENFPDEVRPMQAASAEAPFSSPDYVFEVKWDGLRCILFRDRDGHVRLQDRSLHDITADLPEVVAACSGRVPVLVDGGVRRGTDVFKALALGASAVGIGRPQIWGLAPYGQAGVEAILDIYTRELRAIMRQAGTPSVASITRDFVIARVQAPR